MEKAFPAIITRAQFGRVGKLMRRPRTQDVPSPKGRKHLLAQRIGQVQGVQQGAQRPGRQERAKFAYYVCQSIMKRGKNACVTPRLNARRFEQMIVAKIRKDILTEGSITELVKGCGRGDGRHSQRAAQESGDHRHGA